MTDPADRDRDARRFALESLAAGDATGWFDRLYASADSDGAIVPWDSGGAPNGLLVEWAEGRSFGGGRAIVVGCGYGNDAEFVAALGFETVAFDLSPSAVAGARNRYPQSPVSYQVADLFALPPAWLGEFDFVFESHTVQSLPPALHAGAAVAVRSLVAPGGTLLVLTAIGDGTAEGPPWPLTRAEIDAFGLEPVRVEQIAEVSRWRAEFRR